MSYSASETSDQGGRPVELYEFIRGASAWRYTSADSDVVYGGNTYTAVPIARGAVEATRETARLALEITCDRALAVLDLFATMPPDDIVAVTLRRLHAGDGEAITLWMGRVLNVTWNNAAAGIHCESVFTSLKRTGLRRLYQVPCPHVVYGPGCGLDRAAFDAAAAVTSVSGTTLNLSGLGAFADGHFAGGYLEWSDAGVINRRAIRQQVGGAVTISFPLPGLAASDSVTLYPGCDHTLATCAAKFANALNYGGMPHFTQKNPFSGTPIF